MRPFTPSVLTALLATGCGGRPSGPPPAPPPLDVSVVTVETRSIPIDFDYLGRTRASREVEIRARVSGFLERRHFVDGAVVAAGDLLFEIDARPLQAQMATARAELAAAEARQTQAAREATRLQPLVAEDAVSRKDYDDTVSAQLIADADVAAARARLQQIEVDLGYTRVTAPIAGKIGRALRTEGSLVTNGADGLLAVLLQLDPIYVDFQRSQNAQSSFDLDVASGRLMLPEGGSLTVEVQHVDGTVLAAGGVVDFVDGQLDTTTGTIPMRATLPNPERRLRAGQPVRVVLRGAWLADAVAVPQRAVIEAPQGKAVMVVVGEGADQHAEPRPVEVGEWVELAAGAATERAWVVNRGLQPGDRVIVDNLIRLRPGAPVRIVP